MKTFVCGAVVPGCTARFTAETEQGILEQVAVHAREDHGLPEVPDELVRQVLAAVRDAVPPPGQHRNPTDPVR